MYNRIIYRYTINIFGERLTIEYIYVNIYNLK